MAIRFLLAILAEWLIFSAAWIAACAVALCVESTLILQTPMPSWQVLLFVGTSTFCHYNLHYHYRDRYEALSRRDRWSRSHQSWFFPAIVASGLVSLLCLLRFTTLEMLAVAVMVVMSLLYSLPLLPRGFRLKQLGVLKPIILALVWTVMTVWLPSHQADPVLLSLVLGRRFVFMLILCLAFDVRDQGKDEIQGIRTVPVRWGVPFTYRLIDLLLLFFSVFALLVEWKLNRPLMLFALWASALLTKLAIRATTTRRSELYYLGILDGMMIVQALLVAGSMLVQTWIG